jgi:hypothetical protein
VPVITQAPEEAGPFRQVSRKEAPVLGRVLDLQPVDEGILLLSEGGVSYYQADEWTAYLTMMTGNLIGVDTTQSAWATDANGSISKSNFAVNRPALEDQDTFAWILYPPEEGWSPITTTVGSFFENFQPGRFERFLIPLQGACQTNHISNIKL